MTGGTCLCFSIYLIYSCKISSCNHRSIIAQRYLLQSEKILEVGFFHSFVCSKRNRVIIVFKFVAGDANQIVKMKGDIGWQWSIMIEPGLAWCWWKTGLMPWLAHHDAGEPHSIQRELLVQWKASSLCIQKQTSKSLIEKKGEKRKAKNKLACSPSGPFAKAKDIGT